MRWPKVNLIAYIVCLILDSVIFTVDMLLGQGGSGKISEKFGLPVIILVSILILIGTSGYLYKFMSKVNKIILAILIIFVTFMQLIGLIIIAFLFNMYILAPILGRLGYYVTMP
ncbi:MAG: hypothetical protein WCY12_00280 [Candidatus Omnitrophota bacterium]|jgi:hypothetical protein